MSPLPVFGRLGASRGTGYAVTRIEEARAFNEAIARKAERDEKRLRNLKPFKKGQWPINPGGQPKNARNRIQGSFLNALADDFDRYGKETLARARRDDPMGYIRAIVQLMPKQFEQTTPLEELSDAELYAGIELLKSKLAVGAIEGNGAPSGGEPLALIQAIPETAGIPSSGGGESRTPINGGKPAR